MSVASFAAGISIESAKIPSPPAIRSKDTVPDGSPRAQDPSVDLEMYSMSNIERAPSILRNNSLRAASVRGSTEADPPSNSPPENASEQIQTMWAPYKNRYRVLACCATGFGNGLNDSSQGALIASMERYYNVTYGTVSIIFVCNALGFIAAAFFINAASTKFGRAKTLVIGQSLLMLGYSCIIITPPFPAVCVSFFVLGLGMATNLAIAQVFCSNLANNTALLGFFQGAYGIGGVTGPLIATALVSHGSKWSRFYIIELCLAFANLLFSAWAFWNYEKESTESDPALPVPTSAPNSPQPRRATTARKWQSFKTLLSDTPTILGACFIFAYQGAEVAISGWVISFLVQFRHGDPSKVGFVTSGFWAGITLGRLTLSFLAHSLGERPSVFLFTAGALVLELLVWFVPSIPGDSVAVAFSGLLLGPVYPCAVHIFQRLIPRNMQISSLSLIGSVGSSGGAMAPFMTGMLAQRVGTFVLHPICIGLFGAMAVTWWALPDPEKRDE
ncbi:Bypass of stop codon 6 [Hyphodiscus hymeniophilus]|uniref:Bypass of stop codon 6 n=1 Tax=Hyphodiscus hymeniophilus TaxID=353542 RepID=A0A9P6VJU6_9HELO|nr:Bypass of stop codon 6 [Hyphodiscus hymeniophilus]